MIEMIPKEFHLQLDQELQPMGLEFEAWKQHQEQVMQESRRERIHRDYDAAICKKRRETNTRLYTK